MLRVVLLGAGANIAAAHLRALEAVGGQVVAVQDVNPERAESAAEATGAPAFASVEEALGVPAEAAVIVVPHPFHAPLAIAALEAGRHVLVEKPIGDSAPAESAVHTLELANAMLYSSATGAPLDLPLDRQAYADFLPARRRAWPR
jgi:predicted dehydrogenase